MSIVTEIKGDLFDAPEGAVLIHACNCQGSWGKGIAATFRDKYPAAFQIYRDHCRSYLSNPQTREVPSSIPGTGTTRSLKFPEGTALVIPPQQKDYAPQTSSTSAPRGRGSGRGRGRGGRGAQLSTRRQPSKKHWIVCLFTSSHYGPQNRSPPDVILDNTVLAIEDLRRQLAHIENGPELEGEQADLWGCRFNAGLFGVPWEKTKDVLEKGGVKMTIVSPEE